MSVGDDDEDWVDYVWLPGTNRAVGAPPVLISRVSADGAQGYLRKNKKKPKQINE